MNFTQSLEHLQWNAALFIYLDHYKFNALSGEILMSPTYGVCPFCSHYTTIRILFKLFTTMSYISMHAGFPLGEQVSRYHNKNTHFLVLCFSLQFFVVQYELIWIKHPKYYCWLIFKLPPFQAALEQWTRKFRSPCFTASEDVGATTTVAYFHN